MLSIIDYNRLTLGFSYLKNFIGNIKNKFCNTSSFISLFKPHKINSKKIIKSSNKIIKSSEKLIIKKKTKKTSKKIKCSENTYESDYGHFIYLD